MARATRSAAGRGVRRALAAEQRMSLCETLHRVLNKGVVIVGHVVISIAEVDLIYIGLNVLVSSVETMQTSEAAKRGGLHALR